VTPIAKVPATAPMTLVGLRAKLKAGSASVTSAHLTMSGTLGGQNYLSVQGDETLTDGNLGWLYADATPPDIARMKAHFKKVVLMSPGSDEAEEVAPFLR